MIVVADEMIHHSSGQFVMQVGAPIGVAGDVQFGGQMTDGDQVIGALDQLPTAGLVIVVRQNESFDVMHSQTKTVVRPESDLNRTVAVTGNRPALGGNTNKQTNKER
jgi:hypothetical protein